MSRPFFTYRCARRHEAKMTRRSDPRRISGNVVDAPSGEVRMSDYLTRMPIGDYMVIPHGGKFPARANKWGWEG